MNSLSWAFAQMEFWLWFLAVWSIVSTAGNVVLAIVVADYRRRQRRVVSVPLIPSETMSERELDALEKVLVTQRGVLWKYETKPLKKRSKTKPGRKKK